MDVQVVHDILPVQLPHGDREIGLDSDHVKRWDRNGVLRLRYSQGTLEVTSRI